MYGDGTMWKKEDGTFDFWKFKSDYLNWVDTNPMISVEEARDIHEKAYWMTAKEFYEDYLITIGKYKSV